MMRHFLVPLTFFVACQVSAQDKPASIVIELPVISAEIDQDFDPGFAPSVCRVTIRDTVNGWSEINVRAIAPDGKSRSLGTQTVPSRPLLARGILQKNAIVTQTFDGVNLREETHEAERGFDGFIELTIDSKIENVTRVTRRSAMHGKPFISVVCGQHATS